MSRRLEAGCWLPLSLGLISTGGQIRADLVVEGSERRRVADLAIGQPMSLYEKTLDALSRWHHLGVEYTTDGCVFIGPMPQLGAFAYFQKLLPPLSLSEIAELEAQVHVPLPSELIDFYQNSNGANFYGRSFDAGGVKLLTFTFNIYGLRKVYREGTADALSRQPYDLIVENYDAFAHEHRLLHITKYGVDGSRVYVDHHGRVIRVLSDRTRANEWPSIEDWMLSELQRLLPLFDDNGELFVGAERTAPP